MTAEGTPKPGILCLAHLGWDFVWQRPQQILSRLAQRYPVIYLNEPELERGGSRVPYLRPVPAPSGITAWQPVFPDCGDTMVRWRPLYARMVREALLRAGWVAFGGSRLRAMRRIVPWFYTPIPWYVLDELPASLVVYDVMDELAAFRGAAPDLAEREERLLTRAGLVFAGGRTLYERRRGRHPNLHLFPSGVTPDDFAAASDLAAPIAPEIASLPRPVLGYYGVLDERLDLGLLRALAAARPEWSIVLVGPVAKIAPSDLPRLPNLYYPGAQAYARLPAFLRGFDVCLMPFAMNEATRHISPTKALEYMAAHKPIVSTPVPDVVANWADIVRIGPASSFVTAVEATLAECAAERAARRTREDEIVRANTWDAIAASMGTLLDAALARSLEADDADGRPRPIDGTRCG